MHLRPTVQGREIELGHGDRFDISEAGSDFIDRAHPPAGWPRISTRTAE